MGTQQNILQHDEESRWACQKQSGKRLILRMDSSSRKIVMTSAHLPGAQWQRIKKGGDLVGKVVRRHRRPCTYWSVMLNSLWQLSNWISNKGQTAKGRMSRHVDGEQGVTMWSSAEMGGDETQRSNHITPHIWFTPQGCVRHPDTAAGGRCWSSQTTEVPAVIRESTQDTVEFVQIESQDFLFTFVYTKRRRRKTEPVMCRRFGALIFTRIMRIYVISELLFKW